jgi:EmrB/QacA subfamily drug resistance transporter
VTRYSRALPLTVAAALFMENMDSSVIATALPAISADIGTDPVSLKLAFTTYLLGLVVALPMSGWVADRFGAKHVFRLAIVLFTISSIMCGFAHSLGWLVFARGIQGMSAALMSPVGRIILLRNVPKADYVNALAWLTLPALVGPLIGPPVGGFLTTYFDWRWIFWMNLPMGVLGLVAATYLMPDTRGEVAGRFDLKGALLAGAGLLCTVFGLTIVGRGLLSGIFVSVLILLGAMLIALYLRHAMRVKNPILDFRLMRVATFRAGVAGGGLYRIGVGAIPFLMPLMLQLGFGMSAFASGMITASSALGALVMKAGAGTLIRRFGFRKLLLVNCSISVVFMAVNALFTPGTPVVVIMVILVVAGFLRSLQFTSMNAMAYSDIEKQDMSGASALFTVAQQLSLAAGVALAALILDASVWMRGGHSLTPVDFSTALLLVALISGLSITQFLRLPVDAGEAISGAARRKPVESAFKEQGEQND